MEGRQEILQPEAEGRLVVEEEEKHSWLLLGLSGDQQFVVQMVVLQGREQEMLILEVVVHWHWRREEEWLEVVVDQRGI